MLIALLLAGSTSARALAADTAAVPASAPASTSDPLNTYLTQITGGQVSAAGLLGVDKSAITDIQTSQDLVVALNPFINGDQKTGYALALTPLRTRWSPMSGSTYVASTWARVAAATTFSYAHNDATVGGANYPQYAVSADTSFYLHRDDDPVIIGNSHFASCYVQQQQANADAIAAILKKATKPNDPAILAELQAQTSKESDILTACMAKELAKARWNAARMAISLGIARIKGPGGDTLDLGKSLTVNATFPSSDRSAINLALRRSVGVLDTTTLTTVTPKYSSSTLGAVRVTYGDSNGTNLRGLIEVSNAGSGSASAEKDVFMYAVGVDKHLSNGLWLEFRYGRNHTLTGGKQQNTGLLNLSFQPSLSTFTK
jgi:hypothetical protein